MTWPPHLAFLLILSVTGGSLVGSEPSNADPARSMPKHFPLVFQKGVNFSHNHSKEDGYGSGVAKESLAGVKALGATHVAIIPTGYSFNTAHPDIFGYRGEDPTLTPQRLETAIADARSMGLEVLLNPHLWVGIHWGIGEWRGNIKFENDADLERWFRQYEEFILYFAKLAQANGVQIFCVGSELEGTALAHPERWRNLIRKIREVFHGPLTYSANWGGEFDKIAFWDELDYVGISAYFPLGDGSPDERRAKAMETRQRLETLHLKTAKPILFVESGFQSQAGAGANPAEWTWGQDVPADEAEQRLCYEIWFETFWDAPWFYGVYWWQWFADPVYDKAQKSGYTFRFKPAGEVVRKWFAKPNPRLPSATPGQPLRTGYPGP